METKTVMVKKLISENLPEIQDDKEYIFISKNGSVLKGLLKHYSYVLNGDDIMNDPVYYLEEELVITINPLEKRYIEDAKKYLKESMDYMETGTNSYIGYNSILHRKLKLILSQLNLM